MSSFDEFAASSGQSRRGSNAPQSDAANAGDEAALTGLFHNAFGPVQPISQDISAEEAFPLDEFEARVMTSCLLTAAGNVPVPPTFESQVMARIGNQAPSAGEAPRSFRSSLLRHTSQTLYKRYRTVVQIAFPLAAAASIVVALYAHNNGFTLGSIFTWPPFSSQPPTAQPAERTQPELQMSQPAEPMPVVQPVQPQQSLQQQQTTTTKPKVAKKKPSKKRPSNEFVPITGE